MAVIISLALFTARLAAVLSAFFLLFSLVDYFAALPLAIRKLYYYASFIFSVYLLWKNYFSVSRESWSDESIIRLIQGKITSLGDTLLSAWQLSKKTPEGISRELTQALIDSVNDKLKGRNIRDVFNFKQYIRVLFPPVAVLLVTASAAIYQPEFFARSSVRLLGAFSSQSWSKWFELKPGNASVAWGSDVTLTLTGRIPPGKTPDLYIRGKDSPWKEYSFDEAAAGSFVYTIFQVTSELEYFAASQGVESPVFRIKPVTAAQFSNFKIRLAYPRYTGLGEITVADEPDISALPGTKVNIEFNSSVALSAAAINNSWGEPIPVKISGKKLSAYFTAEEAGEYFIESADEKTPGDPDPVKYSVNIIQDKKPSVDLISPDSDLLSSVDSEIPVVFQAGDDFGVTRVELVYSKDGQGEQVAELPVDKKKISEVTDYLIRLYKYNLTPGDKIRFYIKAWDNDTAAGPKYGKSADFLVETTNYAIEHGKIEEELKKFQKQLLDLLSDQMSANSWLKDYAVKRSSAAYPGIIDAQASIQESAAGGIESLDGILNKMESDPVTDFSTLKEYKGIKSQLVYLKDTPMRRAVEALRELNINEAERRQNEIIASLEKLSLLSEDIMRYQNMKDIIDSAAELSKSSDDILDSLKGKPEAGELARILDKINDLMAQVGEQLSKFPQSLPEDFVNSPAVKSIDISKSRDLASELSAAVNRGDWKTAENLARELKKQLEDMLETVRSAGQDIGFSSGAMSKSAEEMNRLGNELSKLAERQSRILAKTETINNKRIREAMKKQEDMLLLLAKEQQRIIASAGEVLPLLVEKKPMAGDSTQQSMALMNKVYDEFASKRAYNSQKYLEDIISHWSDLSALFKEDAVSPRINAVLAAEKNILLKLKENDTNSVSGAAAAGDTEAASKEQSALARDTVSLRQSLETVGRKSALIPPETLGSLNEAGASMESAASELDSGRVPQAVESQRNALNLLLSGADNLKGTSESMQESAEGAAGGAPGMRQVKTRGGQSAGFRTAPVLLPKSRDFKPPREFRQELLEAMKEKFPEKFEGIIKEYYRRLTK